MGLLVKSFIYRAFYLCLCLRAAATGQAVDSGAPDVDIILQGIPVEFDSHELGCTDRTGPVDAYLWRGVGYGSNINLMILPWLNAVIHGRKDLALVTVGDRKPKNEPDEVFELVSCLEASNGIVASGFPCLFEPMPHICVFHTCEDWNNFMIARNLSTTTIETAMEQRHVRDDRAMASQINRSLKGSPIDIVTAKAILLDYLHSHWQPWVKRDMQAILNERMVASLKEGPYVGIHVRRGDKIVGEAQSHEVQEYLEKATAYIQNSTEATVSVDEIKGIWLSSDDKNVISQVKESVAEFFPQVEVDRVVWISGRKSEASSQKRLPTRAQQMDYGTYVLFFAELTMLSQADVFVGTFTSNVARAIVLLRESRGMPRSSSLSVDRQNWNPARHLYGSV